MKLRKSWAFWAFALLFASTGQAGGPVDNGGSAIPAVILKVEGEGIAQVHKRSGIVEAAGASGQVFMGDTVLTDARSAVDLMLADGTVVKIGFNSEFKLELVENKSKFVSWLFRLSKGAVRALVEKIPANEVHLRVETPSGTVGVRGTEFVLAVDEKDGSSLYLIEGAVSFGAPDCESRKGCVAVKSGEATAIALGTATPQAPKPIELRQLFANATPAAEARWSLFRDARKVAQVRGANYEDAALKKTLDDASTEFAAAQDRAIGRTKAEREAMQAAIKDGSYAKIIAAADAYAAAKDVFVANSNGGAENLVAQTAASKFRLGQAVVAADAAGVFADKDSAGDDGSAREYKERKNVDYEKSADAKAARKALAGAADDYRDTLAFAEAREAKEGDSLASGDEKGGRKSIRGGGSGAGSGAASAPGATAQSAAEKAPACNAACLSKNIAHEARIAAEGSSNAFQGKKPEAAPVAKRGGAIGTAKTRFFSRTIAGDSCFETKEVCLMIPCPTLNRGSRGNKCDGNLLRSCQQKRLPVRCPENH